MNEVLKYSNVFLKLLDLSRRFGAVAYSMLFLRAKYSYMSKKN